MTTRTSAASPFGRSRSTSAISTGPTGRDGSVNCSFMALPAVTNNAARTRSGPTEGPDIENVGDQIEDRGAQMTFEDVGTLFYAAELIDAEVVALAYAPAFVAHFVDPLGPCTQVDLADGVPQDWELGVPFLPAMDEVRVTTARLDLRGLRVAVPAEGWTATAQSKGFRITLAQPARLVAIAFDPHSRRRRSGTARRCACCSAPPIPPARRRSSTHRSPSARPTRRSPAGSASAPTAG